MTDSPKLAFERTGDSTLVIRLAGSWRIKHGMPTAETAERELSATPETRRVVFDTRELSHWDSSLVNFVGAVDESCRRHGIKSDRSGLPAGLQRLLELAEAIPDATEAHRPGLHPSLIERIGAETLRVGNSIGDVLEFLGQITLAFGTLLRGRARYRRADLVELLRNCSADALGIVTLISFLVGTIFAFMGAVQLQQFGAAIYVADLVAIGMVREMGPMMTAIIMAGRTGAAFAAQLGTMRVTQEVDALVTMGLSPVEYLILPRMLALLVMMPLLCLYSDFFGILGGAAVGAGMLGVPLRIYLHESIHAIHTVSLVSGLVKSAVYGLLVAFAGCLRGFQSGASASDVGAAATSAVVTGIVMIVVACGLFAVVFNVLGI